MSRGARRRQRQQPRTLQVFLIIVLVLLTVCVLVKAFFLKAPEQKAAELPAQPAASDTDSQQSPEEQAAQEALRSHSGAQGRLLHHSGLRPLTTATATATPTFW